MLDTHEKHSPKSRYVGKEKIQERTLDSKTDELAPSGENIYHKVNTQGFKGKVLKGACGSLKRIEAVQLEMSLIRLYEG